MKDKPEKDSAKTVAIIVAHPDDETLWAGGTILDHPEWNCNIISLCRRSDADRAPKFFNVVHYLKADGAMGDLDDGPEQQPLPESIIENTIMALIPKNEFDILLTHNPNGEYTRHLRHEETSKAIINLWDKGQIKAQELWTFAYEDGLKQHLPKAIKTATIYTKLHGPTYQNKIKIMTELYGFRKDSWEVQTTPKAEAFWQFNDSISAMRWLDNGGVAL